MLRSWKGDDRVDLLAKCNYDAVMTRSQRGGRAGAASTDPGKSRYSKRPRAIGIAKRRPFLLSLAP
jgi:hypothetical protein